MLIPKLLKLDKKILRYYLSGIYDADGTLPINPERCKQFFIDITLKDKQIIDEIKNCLDMFGIKTLKPYCRMAKSPSSDFISKTWELRIRKKSEIINFLTRIGFVHPHKFKRQKKLLNIMRS